MATLAPPHHGLHTPMPSIAGPVDRNATSTPLLSSAAVQVKLASAVLTEHEEKGLVLRHKLNENNAARLLILCAAYNKLAHGRVLVVDHSFGDGFYCCDSEDEVTISDELIKNIDQQMREWMSASGAAVAPPLITHAIESHESVWNYFYRLNRLDKLAVLKTLRDDHVSTYTVAGFFKDYAVEPVAKHTESLMPFELIKYNKGMLIRVPTLSSPETLRPFEDNAAFFQYIAEYEAWGRVLNVETVSDLNKAIFTREINMIRWVSEELHSRKLAEITTKLVAEFPRKRIVCIAGPSSSGKTTFARRLDIMLRAHGHRTMVISMDDYFKVRGDPSVPKLEDGRDDFEAIEALDSVALSADLAALLDGKDVARRTFDFKTGMPVIEEHTRVRLSPDQFVVLEGIHGLNPAWNTSLASERIWRIYVSAVTQLNVDYEHRVSTSDNRLLRRIVRDYRTRGYSATQTLARWPAVRKGEERNIFPNQKHMDMFFNTALVYELPVLAAYVVPLLSEVQGPPVLQLEANRLLRLLSLFYPLPEDIVPGISLLREFIGKSDFGEA